VALKVLPPELVGDEERRQRFLREARAAAALTHANIATIYEVSEDRGRVFLVMELIEGETLRERIARGRVPADEAMRIARGIARGLQRAHAKRIIHRDIKPDNVALDADGEPKILDFGLAKLREDEAAQSKSAIQAAITETVLTSAGRTLGTPEYMSPEQARGDAVDGRSDLYSLGVVVYEMLSGRRPWSGASTAELLAAILRDTPAPLRSLAPDAPPSLVEIVERCMARSPDARWPGAREILEALEGATPVADHARARTRTREVVRALLGTLAMVTLALLAYARLRVDSPARGRGITDWPAPKTASAEAAALYREALESFRDGLGDADQLLTRTVAIDPHLAAAHLRLGLMRGTLKGSRESLALAAQSRGSLDARDERLLAFAQSWRNADPSQVLAIAQTFSREHAEDAEMQLWASQALMEIGATAEAMRAIELTIKLDPIALWLRTYLHWLDGDAAGELRDADSCLASAPSAVSCLAWRADVHSMRGQCDEMERDGRRLIALKPSAKSYAPLWLALAARGATPATLEHLDRSAEALVTEAKRLRLQDAARLAARSGDFVAAERSLVDLGLELAGETDEWAHAATADLLALYAEEGETEKAIAVAEDCLRALPTWIHGPPAIYDFVNDTPLARLMALATLRRAGKRTEAEVRSLRNSWQREWFGDALPAVRGHAWTWLYAYLAERTSEAREALAALERYAPLPPDQTRPRHAGARGRVYALVGDAAMAIPLLRAEVDACGEGRVTRVPSGMWWLAGTLRDRLLLGGLLEQKGDRAGACAQYAAIVARWGGARPRSLTAEAARAQIAALGCK
jgi:serine/threonine-protein kinase